MQDLLQAIAQRSGTTGIITADRYFRSIESCFNGGFCPTQICERATPEQWAKALKEAEGKLTYTNDKMVVIDDSFSKGLDGVNHTIMQFDAILTTRDEDRDGDILETRGATVDPRMPLLWQHMPMQPIGKMVRVIEHTDDYLKARFAVADIALGRDAAVLIEMQALRMSHGFNPEEYEPRKGKDGGWHFQKFTIYEGSGVSVPSNVGAVVVAWERNKFHHPAVKAWAKAAFDARPVQSTGYKFTEKIGGYQLTLELKEMLTPPDAEIDDAAKAALEPEETAAPCSCHTKAAESGEEKDAGALTTKAMMECPKCGYEGQESEFGMNDDDGKSFTATLEETEKSYHDIERELIAATTDAELADIKRTVATLGRIVTAKARHESEREWGELLEALS